MRRHPVAALLGLVVVVAAGCSANRSTQPSVAIDESSASVSPTATATATASAAAEPAPSTKAPSRAGFASGAPGNHVENYLRWTSSGGDVELIQLGTGNYRAVFQGLGDPGGVAHVEVLNLGSSTIADCFLDGWSQNGADEIVDVRCLSYDGNPLDSHFEVSFAAGSQGNARFSYLLADQPNRSTAYTPTGYDSVDASRLSIHRTSTGVYDVTLPAASTDADQPWSAQVTAVGNQATCKLRTFTAATRTAQVACWPTFGGQVTIDAAFALTFAQDGSLLGRTDRAWVTGASGAAVHATDDDWELTLPGFAHTVSLFWIVNTGPNESFCTIGTWYTKGTPNTTVRVTCASGDTTYAIAGTW